jgi:hypothetical protein
MGKLKKQVESASMEAIRKAPTKEQWFPANDGLVTVRGILQHLRGRSVNFGKRVRPESVVNDLEQMERILSAAEAASVGFHISIDI